jgi:hypothetical protein
MLRPPASARKGHLARGLLALAISALSGACAGGGSNDTTSPASLSSVSDAVWQSLATTRPQALDGATRISVGRVEVSGAEKWGLPASVDVSLAFSELMVSGLLRRPDVRFVERRRFAAAADAARRGALPSEAPRLGVSVAPDYILIASWSSFGMASAILELQLVNPESGVVAYSWRKETPPDADAVGLARTAVGSLLAQLTSLNRLPDWSDPMANAAPADFVSTSVETSALTSYLQGLAAEERWDWERARQGYQRALDDDPSFFEARVALGRAARLRMGGTLAAS